MSNPLKSTSIELCDDELECVAGGSRPVVTNNGDFINNGPNSGVQINQLVIEIIGGKPHRHPRSH
jgi:hypothetical protein